MGNYISQSQGFLDSLGDSLGRTFNSLKEGYELLNTAIQLPLELIPIIPAVLGAAVSVVVFAMVVKFIIGR